MQNTLESNINKLREVVYTSILSDNVGIISKNRFEDMGLRFSLNDELTVLLRKADYVFFYYHTVCVRSDRGAETIMLFSGKEAKILFNKVKELYELQVSNELVKNL